MCCDVVLMCEFLLHWYLAKLWYLEAIPCNRQLASIANQVFLPAGCRRSTGVVGLCKLRASQRFLAIYTTTEKETCTSALAA